MIFQTALQRLLGGLVILVFCVEGGGRCGAGDPGCCPQCGEQRVCHVMCETRTVSVRRYKVESHEHAPPKDCCCDDRWILGCCKPIRVINLVPHEEQRTFPVRKFVVYRCPHCDPPPVPCCPAEDWEARPKMVWFD